MVFILQFSKQSVKGKLHIYTFSQTWHFPILQNWKLKVREHDQVAQSSLIPSFLNNLSNQVCFEVVRENVNLRDGIINNSIYFKMVLNM
jgi:hypothetical protein